MDGEKLKELQELAQPIKEFLLRNHNPHCTVIINVNQAKLTADLAGITLKNN